ncbi:hypothetical protein LDO32_17045 [Luteimonas sp. Y-2-2-4F]|nr:hypothetical protein [Luteimonas sp. Y-2-2-4F]MCD9033423.1 hypothetical protein [Luteimonas sp. Y-2-2-4F]
MRIDLPFDPPSWDQVKDAAGKVRDAALDGASSTNDFLRGVIAGRSGPSLVHSGEGQPWIPQGQGYDAARNEVLTSYNGTVDGDQRVILSVQDAEIGGAADGERSVYLGGKGGDPSADGPTKAGGVAVYGDYVYVADGKEVYVYNRADIDAAISANEVQATVPTPYLDAGEPVVGPDGEPVFEPYTTPDTPVRAIEKIDIAEDGDPFGASYVTVHDGELYVGQFTQDPLDPASFNSDFPTHDAELRRYSINDETGLFNPAEFDSIDAPHNAQGAAVTETGVLFSTSYGSVPGFATAQLVFQPTIDTEARFETDGASVVAAELPYYGEELNIINGEIWVTHESDADKYRDKTEPLGEIQVYSLDDLRISREDLVGGG